MVTQKDAELFKQVNKANPPQHEKMLPGWTPPEPPQGYRNLVAILVPVKLKGGHETKMWVLDYLDTETGVFASEEYEFDVIWPWAQDYLPQPGDWDAIGIPHLT